MMLRIINLAAFALMVYINYLANALPLNGKTTGEISAQYPNLFVPAGVTFSIWGLIYILLLAFCLLQFTARYKIVTEAAGWLFAVSCILNSAWIFAWHYEKPGLSLVIMVLLLTTLILINYKLTEFSGGLTKAAFGIYLGWISIATIANVTALLVAYEWTGWGIADEAWAILMILTGAAVTVLVIMKFLNPYPGFAVIWAIAGIIIARWPDNRAIIITAGITIIGLAIITVMMPAGDQQS